MGTKLRIPIITIVILVTLSLAGCASFGWPPAAGAQPTATATATVNAPLATTATLTPRPTATAAVTSTPAVTLRATPVPTITLTRTPRPTATRWVVARLTATAQAAGSPALTPTPEAMRSSGQAHVTLSGRLLLMRASGAEIFIIDAAGGELRRLTTGLDPAWSPDGRQVAYTRWDGDEAGLWVIDADGRGARRLYARNLLKEPAWTLDGQAVVFSQQSGGKEARQVCFPPFGCFTVAADPYWRLALVNVADGAYRDLSSDLHSHSPSMASGRPVAVYAGDQGIQSTSLDGVAEQLVRKESPISSPAVSPDGKHIVYMSYLHDHWDLFLTTFDGATSVRLTSTSPLEPRMAQNVAPAWSPDGAHIAFFSDRDGAWQLYVMEADGSGQRPLLADALADIDFVYDFANERMVDWAP